MCSAQWNPDSTDGIGLTTMVGENSGGDSQIVLRDSRNQQILTSGASNLVLRHEGTVTGEDDFLPADGSDADFQYQY